jgi:hypothetical protein
LLKSKPACSGELTRYGSRYRGCRVSGAIFD